MEEYVLILGAGLMQRPSIEAAKELGYKALVIDANPNAVCVPFADCFMQIDLKDKEAIADLAMGMGKNLAGIFTAGTDFSASVSYAAEKCGLPCHTYEAALNASNKVLMRQCFKEHNVPSPDFFEADKDYLAKVEQGKADIKFPKVVKPVDNMGARGCRLVRNEEEFLPALKEAIKYSRTGKVIVEDYMDGLEFSIDALVIRGKVIVTGFADRYIYYSPYFVEVGHSMPSRIPDGVKAEIVDCFKKGIKALGLTTGVAKGDIKYILGKGPMIGEIAARLSGGYMSGWTFPYSSDLNLTKEALKIALGKIPEISILPEVTSIRHSHERAFISIPGKIKAIYGQENAIASPFVRDLFFRVKAGDTVDFPRNNVEKCGNVISVSEDRELALHGAESAVAEIVLRLEPNNKATDDFLAGVELPDEKGFPCGAFGLIDFEIYRLNEEVKKSPVIKENASIAEALPEALKERMCRDWNYRSIEKTVALFDRICPVHKEFDAEKFWKVLIRGGIQGILYYADSLE